MQNVDLIDPNTGTIRDGLYVYPFGSLDKFEKEVDKNLLEEYIDKLADNLPPKRREIFILSRKEGLSNKKIAERLHITESTIETQLSKALAFMKSQMQKHYELILIILFTLSSK